MKHLIVKTVIGVFLSGVILVLSSCGQDMSRKSGPESVVKEMSEGVRDFDMERIRSCLVSVDGENAEDITLPEEEYSWLMDYMKESAATIKYDITETVADGESGKVVVEYEHPDISGILSEVVKEYLGKAFAMAFSGEEFNDETAEKLLTDLFKEKTDTAEIARTATTVTFECITYGGEWKIKKMPDEMIDVLTCNCRTALSDLADIGNSQSADDRAGDEPESLSNDADGGQTSENMANEPEDGIYYKQAPADIQTVCDNIDIKAEYAGREMAVILTNNNDFVVPDLDVTVLFYKDGALIDSDEDGHDVVLPGWSVASQISVPEGADQYKVQISCGWKYACSYRNWAHDVDVQSNIGNDNVMIEFTNNSGKNIEELEYVVLYYKDDQFVSVGYPQDVYGFAAGSTIVEKASPYLINGFDDYKIFINQAHTF